MRQMPSPLHKHAAGVINDTLIARIIGSSFKKSDFLFLLFKKMWIVSFSYQIISFSSSCRESNLILLAENYLIRCTLLYCSASQADSVLCKCTVYTLQVYSQCGPCNECRICMIAEIGINARTAGRRRRGEQQLALLQSYMKATFFQIRMQSLGIPLCQFQG